MPTDPKQPSAPPPAKSAPDTLPDLGDLEIDIIIGDDGEVIFTDLPPELLDVALALDPDSVLACRTAPPRGPSEAGETSEAGEAGDT